MVVVNTKVVILLVDAQLQATNFVMEFVRLEMVVPFAGFVMAGSQTINKKFNNFYKMIFQNSYLSVTLFLIISFNLVCVKSLNAFQNSNSAYSVEEFLLATPQEPGKRIINGEIYYSSRVNLSEEFDLYNSYLLASDVNNITILDRDAFVFRQFDYDLNHINTFANEGRGPGEYTQPMDLLNKEGKYWIADGRQTKIGKHSTDGTLINEIMPSFGVIPHRFNLLENNKSVIFSLAGQNAFHILDENYNQTGSFLRLSGLNFQQKGFILDGYLATENDTIFYAGLRNGIIKAFTSEGEKIYSRNVISPLNLDLLDMNPSQIRSAPNGVLDLTIHNGKLYILFGGEQIDDDRWKYLDIYNSANGTYLHTYLIDTPTTKISITSKDNPLLISLGYDITTENNDRILSVYSLPD